MAKDKKAVVAIAKEPTVQEVSLRYSIFLAALQT